MTRLPTWRPWQRPSPNRLITGCCAGWPPRTPSPLAIGDEVRTAVLLDTETTGLDHSRDEIVELGMLSFDYPREGRIVGVRSVFSACHELSRPISAEVTALTGITDDMVAGQRIDSDAVSAFVASAAIVIANNAAFDRRFAERYWQIFERKAWGCSATEVDWRSHGFAGAQLGYLLHGAGFSTKPTGQSTTATPCSRSWISSCRRRAHRLSPPSSRRRASRPCECGRSSLPLDLRIL
ncbi:MULTISPECIES: exonuclease domain-containing protein [unclassified Bradyrhizobium]|uniref:exonuclease domain-containing protein n=1 Tax=unclassified Bradyrhizobium TaxID=2631580 RepID=UPI002916E89C|nr:MULTISPECIES: exonuclease domain-containing protein [unclassified Bradyrhizobium]